MIFKKWVKSIQTAGYNGARTIEKRSIDYCKAKLFSNFEQCDLVVSTKYINVLLPPRLTKVRYLALTVYKDFNGTAVIFTATFLHLFSLSELLGWVIPVKSCNCQKNKVLYVQNAKRLIKYQG